MNINKTIEAIIKPFTYTKYGKVYVGYKETEGALRVEGLILQIGEALKTQEANHQKKLEELKEKYQSDMENLRDKQQAILERNI